MLEPTIWRIFVVSKVLFFTLAIFSASFLTPIWNDMEVIQSSAYLTSNAFDRALRAILNNYSRWDGTHILVIAMEGYRWESQHAFFPLLPLLMRIGALILYPIPISLLTRCQLTGVFISMISHYFTINNIRQITAIVFPKQKRFINLCTLFATIPPSTPFINATYSESLFAALSTAGMLSLLQRRNLSALGLFLLAGLARSNGIFLSGFFLHQMILSRDFIALATNLILFIISTSPFFLFQMYGVSKYCDPSPVDGKIRSWCTPKLPLQLPNLYSFVQGRYW